MSTHTYKLLYCTVLYCIEERSQESLDISKIVSCDSSSDYMNTLYAQLTSEEGAMSRQNSQALMGPVSRSTGLRKGHSSQELITGDVIIKPVTIDLSIKALWDQGLKEVKLEGISCFGCNMVTLLHAHVPKENQPARIIISNKLR